MYFHSFFCLLASFFALITTTLAAPVQHASKALTAPSTDVDKRQIQALVDVAGILSAADTVLKGLETLIDVIDGDIHNTEAQFTQNLVTSLSEAYPTMNILVYHNQDSGYSLYGATHAHVEMDIVFGFSQGYEVWVFDYGTFELAGDGGYENWAIYGSFSGPSSDVTFYSMNGN